MVCRARSGDTFGTHLPNLASIINNVVPRAGSEIPLCKAPDTLLSPCWLFLPYTCGMAIRMKKTLNIDEKLLREAKLASGAATDTDTVRLGLEALVRHAAYERLRALRGSEPKAKDIPRRREPAARKRRAA